MSYKKIFLRVLYSLAILVLAGILPWYLISILAFIGLVIFKQYAEVVLVGLILDYWYGSHLAHLVIKAPFMTGFLLVYIIFEFMRERVR